jgi:hypothetical protein
VSKDLLGKKLFYFFPEGPYHSALIKAAIEEEYEIYTVSRIEQGMKLISGYSRSLIFINLECPFAGAEDALVKSISRYSGRLEAGESSIIPLIREERCQKSREAAVPVEGLQSTGFSTPPLTLPCEREAGAITFLELLEKKEARGQRRYVRFGSGGEAIASLEIESGGKIYSGSVSDISSAGISFSLDGGKLLPPGCRIDSFRMESDSRIRELTGTISLRRKLPDSSILLVAMFDAPPIGARRRLQHFIHTSLQRQFYRRLEA